MKVAITVLTPNSSYCMFIFFLGLVLRSAKSTGLQLLNNPKYIFLI